MGDGRCSQASATRALSCFLPHVGAVFRRLFPLSYVFRQRPYRVEYTGSLPNSAVKRRRARLVLGWGTAWEDLRVLPASLTQQGQDQKKKTEGEGGRGRRKGKGKGKGKRKRKRQRQRPGPCLFPLPLPVLLRTRNREITALVFYTDLCVNFPAFAC